MDQVRDEPVQSRLLEIYLHDHRGNASGGMALAERCLNSNSNNDYGPVLEQLVSDFREDTTHLRTVLSAFAYLEHAPVKEGLAWVGEKLGRLKLNGRLMEYSPLSRVLELEGLYLSVTSKLRLWQALGAIEGRDERIAAFDFSRMQERARDQARRVGDLHDRAVRDCFCSDVPLDV